MENSCNLAPCMVVSARNLESGFYTFFFVAAWQNETACEERSRCNDMEFNSKNSETTLAMFLVQSPVRPPMQLKRSAATLRKGYQPNQPTVEASLAHCNALARCWRSHMPHVPCAASVMLSHVRVLVYALQVQRLQAAFKWLAG